MFDRRGVSESLGFILVFGIIVSMTSLVYVTGFADLQDTRDFEQANNAERAFNVLKANVEDVNQRGAPSRGTEVKLTDSKLYTADPVSINVTVHESGDPLNNATFSPNVSPIVYEGDDGVIVYSNGAIFRKSSGGVAMVEQPAFVVSDDRVVMSLVQTYPEGGMQSMSGSKTVLVRTLNDHSDGISDVLDEPDADEYNVTVTIVTPRADAWARYFEDEGFDDCNVTGDTVVCWKDGVEHVQVTRTRIKVIFE